MVNFQFNRLVKRGQVKIFLIVGLVAVVILAIIITLLAEVKPRKLASPPKELDLTGIVDESFTTGNAESAMTAQQSELESLKKSMHQLQTSIKTMNKSNEEQLAELNKTWQHQFDEAQAVTLAAAVKPDPVHEQMLALNGSTSGIGVQMRPAIHTVSFRKITKVKSASHLDPAHYVPSNTSVRAVVLGGADADASVNGQSKNHGVMLFKLLDAGSLPNGQRSRLQGCRVSANTFGDISSERAFGALYRLSCAHPGQPIIDKEITGWVFYNGKVGIKGKPLMRDNKIMQWAGISGALSGVAQAAQYAQSVQQFGAYGTSSIVPSSNIGPFAAYGGASKAADKLSEYYIQRAEQYHPVIQVGSGNVVTIVFKDGFYLEPDEDPHQSAANEQKTEVTDMNHFNVPPEVLNHLGGQG